MIISHRIDLKNNEEVLYIFFDFSYEIGKFGYIKEEDIFSRILKYIREKKIKFSGKTIMMCTSGIVFATLLFSPLNIVDLKYNDVEVIENVLVESNTKQDEVNNYINLEETEDNIKENIEDDLFETKKNEDNIKSNELVEKKESNNVNEVLENEKEINQDDSLDDTKMQVEEVKYINPVTIYRNNGEILTLELEDYLIGVVAAEMPASFNIEALKAQAVAARTYTLKYISEGKKLTDTEATQSYKDIEELKIRWGIDFDKYYKKIQNAVKSTEGIYMTYNDKYIDAVYHASNNGYTVSSVDVWNNDIAYLNSVDSIWDIDSSSYLREKILTLEEFNQKLGINFNVEKNIDITKDETNHVKNITIDNNSFTGIEFRQKLGLRSTDFDVEIINENIKIVTRGYGHGVGMSQYGANGMANSGYNYLDILNHYYQGITIVL